MTDQEKLKVLKSCVLFEGLRDEGLERVFRVAREMTFSSGELLFSSANRRLGVITAGSANAVKPKKNGTVTMSLLGFGDVFGAVSIMGGELPMTEARAKKTVTALVFDAETFKLLMREDFRLTENYCRYLIGRIRFLTERVECMSCSSSGEKLLRYLETNAENGVCRIPFGMDALAKAISMSRATLYRAFDELEGNGRIARNGHDVRLL